MNAGRLSDRLLFEKRVTSGSPPTESWATDFGGPIDGEAQRISETSCRFIIRYRKTALGAELSALSHRITWDGAVWHIASAVHDRRRTMLTLDCDLSNMLEATHLQSTTREYIEGTVNLTPRED